MVLCRDGGILVLLVVVVISGLPGVASTSADGSEAFAVLGEVLSNVSSLVGDSAQFYCEVIGSQGIGEELKFFKVAPVTGVSTELSSNGVVTADASKYSVSERYRLTIRDVNAADAAAYTCVLGTQDPEVAYLQVLDPPASVSLHWGDGGASTPVDKAVNLTCEAGASRPPASFRWLRGGRDVTGLTGTRSVAVDGDGYGRGVSYLELIPNSCEGDVVYTCQAFLPGVENRLVETQLTVTLTGSGVQHVSSSVCLVFIFLALIF